MLSLPWWIQLYRQQHARELAGPERRLSQQRAVQHRRVGWLPVGQHGSLRTDRRTPGHGSVKAPSLRNIAVTAPYMHDGSIETLPEVLDHYARGGRVITDGPYAGDGSRNPYRSEFVRGFELTTEERADLLAFLESLTDQSVLSNAAWSDPATD